jgi:hypothetical protein
MIDTFSSGKSRVEHFGFWLLANSQWPTAKVFFAKDGAIR